MIAIKYRKRKKENEKKKKKKRKEKKRKEKGESTKGKPTTHSPFSSFLFLLIPSQLEEMRKKNKKKNTSNASMPIKSTPLAVHASIPNPHPMQVHSPLARLLHNCPRDPSQPDVDIDAWQPPFPPANSST